MISFSSTLARTCFAAALLSSPFCASAQTQPAPTSQPTNTVVAPGHIAAFYSVDLYSKESGFVTEVSKDIGDHVKVGEQLAVIDSPELKYQVAAATATVAAKLQMIKAAEAVVNQVQAGAQVAKKQLAGTEADQKLMQMTLKRQEELFANNAITVQQLDEMRAKTQVAAAAAEVSAAKITSAEADVLTAQANLEVAKAQHHVAEADMNRLEALLKYTKVVSPFDGVITKRMVNLGDLVQNASNSRTIPMFTVQKIDTVRVYCDVPESSVAAIGPGATADIKCYGLPGIVLKGTVTRIATALDPATRTMKVEIDLPNPNETLRPGMYAQVTLTPAEKK